jgi:hypothetical protein
MLFTYGERDFTFIDMSVGAEEMLVSATGLPKDELIAEIVGQISYRALSITGMTDDASSKDKKKRWTTAEIVFFGHGKMAKKFVLLFVMDYREGGHLWVDEARPWQ